MYLSTVDRFVSKLRPVNALVEHLCERLLPNEVAHADGCPPAYSGCLFDWGCGVETGESYALYCQNPDGSLSFIHCKC